MLLELLENDIQSASNFLLAEANTCSEGSNSLADPIVNIIASYGLDDVLSMIVTLILVSFDLLQRSWLAFATSLRGGEGRRNGMRFAVEIAARHLRRACP
jgi:hypothetical protein